MTTKNKPESLVWVIRAGKAGENDLAHKLFTEQNLLVLARQDMGNLRRFQKNRQAFCSAYALKHAEEGTVAIAGIGGKFFRFIHEMKNGDLVLYPSRFDKRVYFGEIIGSYFYNSTHSNDFPHCRKVHWIGSFQKASLSEGAARELGAARILFSFKSHIVEIFKLISKTVPEQNRTDRRIQPK